MNLIELIPIFQIALPVCKKINVKYHSYLLLQKAVRKFVSESICIVYLALLSFVCYTRFLHFEDVFCDNTILTEQVVLISYNHWYF